MYELKLTVPSPELATILIGVLDELRKAEAKHSWSDTTLFEQISILTEEVGEAAMDANDRNPVSMKIELKQVAATAIRMLLHNQ